MAPTSPSVRCKDPDLNIRNEEKGVAYVLGKEIHVLDKLILTQMSPGFIPEQIVDTLHKMTNILDLKVIAIVAVRQMLMELERKRSLHQNSMRS